MIGMAEDKRVKVYDSVFGNVVMLPQPAADAALADKDRFSKTKPKDWDKVSAPKRRADRYPQKEVVTDGSD